MERHFLRPPHGTAFGFRILFTDLPLLAFCYPRSQPYTMPRNSKHHQDCLLPPLTHLSLPSPSFLTRTHSVDPHPLSLLHAVSLSLLAWQHPFIDTSPPTPYAHSVTPSAPQSSLVLWCLPYPACLHCRVPANLASLGPWCTHGWGISRG